MPVVSVNVPEVDVEFMRVREKALPAFLARYHKAGQRSSWELSNQGNSRKRLSELADPVYVTRFVLDGKKTNAR